MDIIVTVPKDQIGHVVGDKASAGSAWWKLPSRPRSAHAGDRIGFVWDGHVQAVAHITLIRRFNDQIDAHFRSFRFLETPIPKAHFRGFHYYDLSGAK